MKLEEAANATDMTRGFGSTPMLLATVIAIGTMRTAVELLETISLSRAVIM